MAINAAAANRFQDAYNPWNLATSTPIQVRCARSTHQQALGLAADEVPESAAEVLVILGIAQIL